ncbi:hypothetical protein DYP60_01465 [Sphaerochaeta halotolerans]|uniref:Uncharacterized protein n=1 Tax=Sphaerochaeta halotolerans TaxID=2293840 RepID=A0A372MKF5_9SPIR|nr:hypothetical protein [Sphaerochaeta halotolerans]RFU96262.1 hypothetical protein DYP60_01465 [Sphaerochaeta halotolerans]
MKGINTSGQELNSGGVASFSAQGTGYLTLLSLHSLPRGTIMMIPFLSLHWGMIMRNTEKAGIVLL